MGGYPLRKVRWPVKMDESQIFTPNLAGTTGLHGRNTCSVDFEFVIGITGFDCGFNLSLSFLRSPRVLG